MKRYFFLSFLFFLIPTLSHAEYIESFDAQIEVLKDSSFTVTETLDYRFSEARHGIYREIPLTHPEKPSTFFKERYIDVALTDVRMDGKEVPYALESSKDRFKVRIGDPNATIEGAHTYTIRYTVYGGLSFPKGEGAELYWNVTGNDWTVPIRVVRAVVSSPDEVLRSVRSCYRGTFGSTSGSCLTTNDSSGGVIFRTTELMTGEGMTIAQSVDITRIEKDIRERTNMLWLIIPLLGIAVLYGGYRVYAYNTHYRTGKPIIPQYEPYPGVKPMYAGLLMDGRLDPRDLTAGIVYLAEQGYLKIRKTEQKVLFLFEVDDYELELRKVPDESISSFEKRILGLLFDEPFTLNQRVALSTLKNDRAEQQKNHVAFEALQSDLRKDLNTSGFYEHFKFQRILIILGSILLLALLLSLLATGGVQAPILIVMLMGGAVTIAILNRRRTRAGYEALDHLKGFKLFLEVTDRDRFAFHNAPEKSPEQFMEFLPYAIAFGVEKQWAKVFENFTLPVPEWYEGTGPGSFSSTDLSSSLGAFSHAFAASGASASSGGGHSGGGAGGGGGGSW